MKNLKILLLLALASFNTAYAETFVETIAQLSARDAVTVHNGALYASNYNTGAVYRIELNGSVSTVLPTSARGPAGIRFDDNGNMYVAMYNIGSVVRVDADGNESSFASAVQEPIALDWDNAGNLYVSHFAGGTTVTSIAPDGTKTALPAVSQLSSISSLCLDDNDDIYISSYSSGDIYKMTPAGDISLFGSSNAAGYGFLQYDSANDVFYATDISSNRLIKFDAAGNSEVIISSPQGGTVDGPLASAAIDSAIGLAVSEDGKHLYFAGNTHIRRLNFADPAADQVRPYFLSEPNATGEGDVDFSHQFQFEDPNGDPLILTIEDIPDWLAFDGVDTLSGVPASSEMAQNFQMVAALTDGFDTVSQAFTVTISASTAVPVTPAPAPTPEPTPVSDSSGGGSLGFTGLILVALMLLRRNGVSVKPL